MDPIRFVTHQGQRVSLLDFTASTPDQVAELSSRVPELITQEPKGSVLVVADFSGVKFNREIVEHIKIATAIDRPHIKRAAWVLTENLPKALYDSIRSFSAREIPVFDSREKALDYLVS